MAITIRRQPANLSLVGNMEHLIVDTDGDISFSCKKYGANVNIVERVFSPCNGSVEIDLYDIIYPELSFSLQNLSEPYCQQNIVKTFEVTIQEVGSQGAPSSFQFTAIRSGVDRLGDTADNFLQQNFLTWQPNVKPVTYYTPEFLTYYAVVAAVVKCKVYIGNSSTTVTLKSIPAGQAWTIPLQYGIIAGLVNGNPSYYDVWAENGSGQRMTYIQRYYAQDMKSENEQWILFENSLGGIDTFRAYGNLETEASHAHNVAEIEEVTTEYRVDTERKFKKNTGRLDRKERLWLLDFFPSLKKYVYVGDYIRQIVVTESDVNYKATDLPSQYNFTYKYADAKPYLNLPRTDAPLDVLNIEIPDSESFTVAPRLVEFPRTQLSSGALFLTQDPYSENWGSATLGAIVQYFVQYVLSSYSGGGTFGHVHSNFDFLELLSEQKIREFIKKHGVDFFLSKLKNDTAQGFISFLQGLQVAVGKAIKSYNYIPNEFSGTGFALFTDENGVSTAEIDKLIVRMKAVFQELEVKRRTYSAGNVGFSDAANKVVLVLPMNGNGNVKMSGGELVWNGAVAYRCCWLMDDGETAVTNDWSVDDQARCQTFNIKEGTSYNVSNRYYWRKVLAVGDSFEWEEKEWNYIDLAASVSGTYKGTAFTKGCQTGVTNDVPAADDQIIQFGNQDDSKKERQNFTEIIVNGNNAPAIMQYQGVNDYTFSDKLIRGDYYDPTTQRYRMVVYGDAYIGSKDGTTTYIKYNSGAYNAQTNPDGGKLQIKAVIDATSPISGTSSDITTLGGILNNLQSQIDGSIETLYGDVDPSIPANDPYKDYTTAEKEKHLGDMYYNSTTGYAYRYDKTVNGSTTTYGWTIIRDTGITQAIAEAAAAYNLAGTKAKIYVTTTGTLPPKPYNKEDLWVNATGTWGNITYDNDILKCITACDTNGTPSISHWTKASKYTDDTALHNYIAALLGKQTYESGDDVVAATVENAIRTALGGSTVIDGGLMLTSLLALRKLNPNGDPSDVNDYTTWAGISGIYDSQLTSGGIAAWYGGDMIDYESLTDTQKNAGWGTGTNQTRFARSLFRFDGSGYLAGGNISWGSDGKVYIKDIHTLTDDSDHDLLNEMADFHSMFDLSLWASLSQIHPNQSFDHIYISHANNYVLGNNDVLTYGELKDKFVTVDFFEDLFQAQDSSGNAIATNNPNSTTINRLKILVGAYTDQYLSALGLNPNSGGGGGSTTLADLLDTEITNPTDGQILKYVVQNNVGKWVNAAPPETYTLPTASSSTLGGVKIGTTLAINSTTGVLNLASVTLGTPASGDTTYTKVVVDSYGRISKATTLAAADIPDISGTYATSSRVSTLEGYFTSGIANEAAKLSTTSKTAWGQTYWTSGGVPTNISGNISNTGNVTPSATASKNIGSSTLMYEYGYIRRLNTQSGYDLRIGAGGTQYIQISNSTGATTLSSSLSVASGITLTTTKKITFGTETNAPYIEVDSNGYFHFSAGLYSDSFVSALGQNSSGGGGGGGAGDVTWDALASNSDTRYIAPSHLIYGQGTSDFTDGTEMLTSYANNDGFSGTYAARTYRRPASKMWNYIKSKADSVYLALSGGTMTGSITMGGSSIISQQFDVDTSRFREYSWKNTSGTTVASVGYHNTGQNIILNPIGSSNVWTDAVGKYSLFVGNNLLTYNTYPILTSNNIGSYNAGSATKLQTSRSIWGQSFNGTAAVSGNLYMIDPDAANINQNSAKLKFNCYDSDDTRRSPYIQAIKPSSNYSYSRKRLGFFTSNAANFTDAFVEAISITPDANVGVNNTEPSIRLDVAETASAWSGRFHGSITSEGTVTSRASAYLAHGSGNGLWLGVSTTTNSNYIAEFRSGITGIGGGGTSVMRINADGNVGIGTTSPANLLDVNGTIGLLNSGTEKGTIYATNGAFAIYSAASTEIDICYGGDNTKAVVLNSTAFKPYNAATGALDLGTTSARWKGIYGTTLNISSTSTFSGLVTLYRETTTDDDLSAGLTFSVKDTTTGKTYSNAYIRGYQDHDSSSTNGLNMVIRPGGNMFLGSGESPSNHYALKKGSTTENTYITSDSNVYIQANGNTIANRRGFYINTSNNIIPCVADTATNAAVSLGTTTYRFNNICGTVLNISSDTTLAGHLYMSNNKKIYFKNSSSTNKSQITYDSSNNLVLGESQTESGYNTYVRGNVSYIQAGTSHSNVLMCTDTYVRALVGFYSDSYVSALGQNTSSDERLKDIRGNATLNIDDIAAAPSVKYLWKDKDLGLQAGSIAQYWQNVLPECVHTDTDGYLSMEYGVIALLASIATAKKVQDHEKRIKELEKENERLRTEVEQLKA